MSLTTDHTKTIASHPLNTVLTEMGDGVMVCNGEGHVYWLNRPLQAMLEITAHSGKSKSVDQNRMSEDGYLSNVLLSDSHADDVSVAQLLGMVDQVLIEGQPLSEEIRLKFPNERRKNFHVFITPALGMFTGSEVETWRALFSNYSLVVFRDISAIKTTEKMRRDFVANVSHELRTPLSVLKGYAETLLDGALEDPDIARNFVDVIHQHSVRLTQLVQDLLDLSRLESPDEQLELEAVDITKSIKRVLMMLTEKATDKHIQLDTNLPKNGMPKVLAQATSIEQVLINLIDNAIKYSPESGHVTLNVADVGQFLQFSIVDTGSGIEAKHIPRLFERFYRVDKARSRELGGTGLGLSIVKHIVMAHGGNIWVESTPGEGSAFHFTLRKAPKGA